MHLENKGEFHHPSGWSAIHCGHPTANWPYFLQHRRRRLPVVSFNGYGFKTIAAAKLVIDGILAGRIQVTRKNCNPNIARTANATAFGKIIEVA